MKVINIHKDVVLVSLSPKEVDHLECVLRGDAIEYWSFAEKSFAGKLQKSLEDARFE